MKNPKQTAPESSTHESVAETKKPTVLTIEAAVKHIADQTGISVAPATVHRWMTKGFRGNKLAHRRVGVKIITTLADVDRFLDRMNDDISTTPTKEQL